MRADTELFKDKIEISLDGRQIFYLFFGGSVLASLVFVLGVMVGKRVEARAHIAVQPETAVALDPLAALDALARKPSADDLSFSNALAGDEEIPLGEVDRLLTARVAQASQRSSSRPARQGAGTDNASGTERQRSGANERQRAATAGADSAANRAPRPTVTAARPTPKATPRSTQSSARARFTLQLSSFQDRAEADAFFGNLKDAGYKPYIAQSEVEGKGVFYRVRLGRYPSYEQAIAAKKVFEDKMHIIAYVTRLSK